MFNPLIRLGVFDKGLVDLRQRLEQLVGCQGGFAQEFKGDGFAIDARGNIKERIGGFLRMQKALAYLDRLAVDRLKLIPEPMVLGGCISNPVSDGSFRGILQRVQFAVVLGVREDLCKFESKVGSADDPLAALEMSEPCVDWPQVALGDHSGKSVGRG